MSRTENILHRARAALRGFLRDRRGNVAMMFGIALVPLAIAAGVGLDFARAMMVRSSMNEALDAAGLAIASSTGLDRTKAQELAQKYFDANYKGVGTPTVTISENGYNKDGSVTLEVSGSVPTTLMRLAKYDHLDVKSSATVVWGQTKLWVSLVLDNSGSMDDTDYTGTSKMTALKGAAKSLIDTLKKAAASTPENVKVTIVPFSGVVNVGTGNASKSWLDWTDWEAKPVGYTPDSTVGYYSSCPFTDAGNNLQDPYQFYCTTGPTNGASRTANLPTSGTYRGWICPGMGYGDDHHRRYFNGCWDSVPSQTRTVTETETQPQDVRQTCSQTGSGTITCTNKNNYPRDNGRSTVTTTSSTSNGYTSDSTDTDTTTTKTSGNTDGTKDCSGNGNKRKCTWDRSYTQNEVTTTVTKRAYNFSHTWRLNQRSTWKGCVVDRQKKPDATDDFDAKNSPPSSEKFPAANVSGCLGSTVMSMMSPWDGTVWDKLKTKIDNMATGGSTNQGIGFAHGWQTLTNSDPYSPGATPGDTTRYVILFSDGLNTVDRWWGTGADGTPDADKIDGRMKLACDNAKQDGVVIYTIFLNLGGKGDSSALQYCASDSTKYYGITSNGAVVTAFEQIGKDITNVHVSR